MLTQNDRLRMDAALQKIEDAIPVMADAFGQTADFTVRLKLCRVEILIELGKPDAVNQAWALFEELKPLLTTDALTVLIAMVEHFRRKELHDVADSLQKLFQDHIARVQRHIEIKNAVYGAADAKAIESAGTPPAETKETEEKE